MKSPNLQKTQCLLTFCFLLIALTGFSQRTITWKGGTPGMKNDWFCPQNWSTATVPDEFSDVIIPDVSTSSFAHPVIEAGQVEINSITIHSQGALTISKEAALFVSGYVEGVGQKNIQGEGQFVQYDDSPQVPANMVEYKARTHHIN